MAWLALGAALAAAYAQTFVQMWARWFPAWRHSDLSLYDRIVQGESYYTHGPLAPLVSLLIAVLLVRHTRIPLRPSRRLGAAVLALSLLGHLLMSLARVSFASGFTLLGTLCGLILLLWGRPAMRRLWFPVAFLAFMVPLPEVTIAQLNFRLKMLAADLGVSAAGLLGMIVERSGNVVFLAGGKQLVIANVCNGLRTLISLLAFGALYAYVCRLRGPWRLMLLAMTVPVAVAVNAVRIVSLIFVADVWNPEAATGWWHDLSGLLIFALAFMMMFGLEKLVLTIRAAGGRGAETAPLFGNVRRLPQDGAQWQRLRCAARAGASMTAIASLVVTAGMAWWLNRPWTAARPVGLIASVLPSQATLVGQTWRGSDLPLDRRTMDVLENPEYLFRRYFNPGDSDIVDFCVIFSRDNRKGTHPPDLCLEGGGQDILAKTDRGVAIPGLADLPCRELIVQSGTQQQYFLYTYKCGGLYTRSFWRQQLVIFANGLLSRNAGGALIRVSMPMTGDLESSRRRADEFMRFALPYLQRALP